jgi:O-antigen/teichoic acid export membrane protein
MGIIQRQSIKGTLVYIIGAAIHFTTMCVLIPKLMAEQDSAVYRVCVSLLLLFSIVGLGGAQATLLKHLPDFEYQPQHKKVFNFVTLIYTIIVAAITVGVIIVCKNVLLSWKGSNTYLMQYFWCVPLGSFFGVLLYYFEYYSMATYRLTAPSVVREIILKLILLISVVLLHYQLITTTQFFLIFALSYAICALVMIVYCVAIRGYRIGFDMQIFKTIPFQQYLPYTFFIFLLGCLAALMLNTDQPIIYSMCGANAINIYGLAVTIASMITIPYKPLSAILLPFMYEAWKTNDTRKLNEMNRDSAKNLTAIGVLLFLLLICNVHHLFAFMPAYVSYIKIPLIIIGVGRVLDYTTGASTELLISAPTHKKMIKYMAAAFLFSLICYKLLIPAYQEIGAAIACTATLIFYNILKYTHLRKQYNLQPLCKESFYFIGLGFLVYGVQYLLPNFSNFMVDIFIRSTIITILFCSIIFYYKWIPMVNDMVNHQLKKQKN